MLSVIPATSHLYDVFKAKLNDGEDSFKKRLKEELAELESKPLIDYEYWKQVFEENFDNDYFKEMKNDYKESLVDAENYKEVVVKKKVNGIFNQNHIRSPCFRTISMSIFAK